MKLLTRTLLRLVVGLSPALTAFGQSVVINEIMYHPLQPATGPEPVQEEYIELFNREATNVNLTGWTFSKGVSFTFPANSVIAAGGYLVVAANATTIDEKYPAVGNLAGNWVGTLANNGETIELKNAAGDVIDSVSYADQGDWAIRQRSPAMSGQRGWIWFSAADGAGRSMERRNPALLGDAGQNWEPSSVANGTPGAQNSVFSSNVAPLILDATHLPLVPTSSDPVSVTARIVNETTSGVTVTLFYRVDSLSPPEFTTTQMFDDGAHGDGAPGDRIYGVVLPAMGNDTLIEFYISASDAQGNNRTWPGPTYEAADLGGALLGQLANAMFQVDDSVYPLVEPLYKLIMTASQWSALQTIFNSAPQSDAQVNATFFRIDGTGVDSRYLSGVRNRGNGSRGGTPHNYRINIPSDRTWRGVTALNLNARSVPAQLAGSIMAQKAGVGGADVHLAQLRVNNGPGPGGTPANSLYAANEAKDSDWSDRIFPDNSGGNVYLVQRNIPPPNFNYRGTLPSSYRNTYFKQSNVSADDWSDLIAMLEVMGENQTGLFTMERARSVIDVEQWLRHLAVMNMFGNNESGINTGNNDDYYLYSGTTDRRFQLIYHDLDTVLGLGGAMSASNTDIFRATCCPISGDSEGIWRTMNFFMHHPEVEPLYYRTLQDLIDGPFSAAQFDPAIDTLFASYPQLASTATTIKNYMATRRTTIQSVINGLVPPSTKPPLATIAGTPRAVTPFTSATLTVGGEGVTHYRFRLNNGAYGPETPVATPITLNGLANGSSNTVYVIAKSSQNIWQSQATPTVSPSWIVNTSWPGVRLNEVLARNDSAVAHEGTFPDMVELFNEGSSTVNLAGMRMTDDLAEPNKFTFPAGTSLAPGAYLILYADSAGGTGLHLGFALGQSGDAVYLLQPAASGSAVLDSVKFGLQVANRSIGRFGNNNGDWLLAQPTFGNANVTQAVGNPAVLKINEWFAASEPPLTEDFIELYNPAPLPVSLAGLYLTDQPMGRPAQHAIAPISFLDAGGFTAFIADGQDDAGADHVNFRLSADLGSVALFDATLRAIDYIIYVPQKTGVSMGRCPDGGVTNIAQSIRTPGSANFCPTPPPPPPDPVMVNLIPVASTWRYNTNGVEPAPNWKDLAYDDSGWNGQGQAALGRLRNGGSIPEPLLTPLPAIPFTAGGKMTFYFRTRFNVPAGSQFTSLQISNLIDDGAVFYLNGVEVGRFNMNPGTVSSNTPAAAGLADATWQSPSPATIPTSRLLIGENVLAAEVHQAASGTAGDNVFALRLDGLIVTNIVQAGGLVINEVLADNQFGVEVAGRTPDWIEFYNPTANSVDLGGMSLNDQPNNSVPRWTFPAGSIVPGRGYLVIYADADLPVSATNTGFGLKANGGSVYLFNRAPKSTEIFDSLDYGLQTPDHSIGRVPVGSANWTLTFPTPGADNVPAVLGSQAQLRVNEWMADPASGDDWFEVFNGDTRPVALGNLRLTDTFGSPNPYRIPPLSFIGVGSNAFVRFEADNPSTPSGAEHVNFKLSKDADSIFLLANNGAQIDAVSFGMQQTGVSQGRLPDGATNIVSFPQTPTPKDSNFLPLGNVVINEVLTHTDLPLEDAIELRNTTTQPIDIGGWWLSDDKDALGKFRIPNGTMLPASGFRVFYEIQFNNDTNGVPFSLSSSGGDQVYLSQATGAGQLTGYRAVAKFGPAANGVSFGRYVNALGEVDYPALSALSFGTSVTPQNPPGDIVVFRTGQGAVNAAPKVGPIILSEIMYHPPDDGTNDNVVHEFIELRNTGTESVPLYDPAFPTNGWRLDNGIHFTFSAAHLIPAGGHLIVVSFDPATNASALASFRTRYGTDFVLAGPYSGKLDNSSETVELLRPDVPQGAGTGNPGLVPYILVEKVHYGDLAPWPTGADGQGMSVQRVNPSTYANEPANWTAAAPNPGPGGGGSDSDGDGMPDSWEQSNGLNPNSAADATLDADGDGMSNRDEYRAGTNPQSAADALRLLATRNGGVVELRFTAVAGKSYSVLYSTTPANGTWQRLANVPSEGGTTTVMIPDSTGGGNQRFYRVITPALP